MKISKKLIATAAMAAVCCTLHMPIIAGAEMDGAARTAPTCPPHHMEKHNEQNELLRTGTHEYVFYYVYNDDGTIDYEVKAVCKTRTTYHQYDLHCKYCRMILPQQGPGTVTTHSGCGKADEYE